MQFINYSIIFYWIFYVYNSLWLHSNKRLREHRLSFLPSAEAPCTNLCISNSHVDTTLLILPSKFHYMTGRILCVRLIKLFPQAIFFKALIVYFYFRKASHKCTLQCENKIVLWCNIVNTNEDMLCDTNSAIRLCIKTSG